MPPPYHLEVLAGRLIGNHDVHILDMRIDEDLDNELLGFRPDVVGCSCVAANSHLAKQVLRKVKEVAPTSITSYLDSGQMWLVARAWLPIVI